MRSRFLVAGGLLILIALARGRAFSSPRIGWRCLAVLGLLNYGLYLGLTSIALEQVSGGLGTVLASINPLMLAAIAPFVLLERVSRLRLAGMLAPL